MHKSKIFIDPNYANELVSNNPVTKLICSLKIKLFKINGGVQNVLKGLISLVV
jgi:hypothetical protein